MRVTWAFASLLLVSCGDDGGAKPDAAVPPDVAPDAPVETLGPAPALAQACTDSKADVYNLPTGLPAMSDMHRGDVVRCAVAESLSTYKVNAQIDAYNATYMHTVAGHATTGFWTWRIAYRTERNTIAAARAEGDSAAVLLVPEHPLAGAPLVVFGHGSVGVAPQCAPSHLDLSAAAADEDYPPILLRLAGAGYTVIAPDYAGFSYGQAPGYFQAEDEAHSILDASRAAKNILGTAPDKVVFVGHSQGGHAVIAAQSYAAAYGHYGTLVGVAAMAPLWMSLSLFGAAVTSTGGLSTSTDVNAILYAMEYAYSEGELHDGPGHGVDVFATAKQTDAKNAMLSTTSCYDAAKLQALGANPMDFFDTSYVNLVGNGCALQGTCTDPLAAKWKNYWIGDRPNIDPMGAPVLVMFGGNDGTVSPPRAKCGADRLAADVSGGGATATVTTCYSDTTAHRDFPRTADADYLIQWIGAQAGINAAPAACDSLPLTTCPPIPQNY